MTPSVASAMMHHAATFCEDIADRSPVQSAASFELTAAPPDEAEL
jgi:hypothetical protein